MTEPQMLTTPEGRRLAYHRTEGAGPGIVFLGGFMSDMEGTKATHLEAWAKAQGRAFLRFDYSGHGQSSGRFDEGAIGDWAADARAALGALTEGPQVLVGSSMGGWIALLLARALPERVAGLVGIAAAPDFTEDSMWAGFSDARRAELTETGRVELPSAYADSPYVITRRLVEDGRRNLVLRDPLAFGFPVRLLQGTADEDVETRVALRLLERIEAEDLRLTLVKGADHRFSTPETLALIESAILEIG
ncbi:pimeloyl-ACP methyl ester carboxylesterase [Rhodovulum sulfidophilum]|uniref:alpha/beta fold hydrolase n=1 Tax=Rhodovulum sulfidophilum TaxID=35806 RepID=UPI0005A5EAAD|nr:alpha/beta hydrolase [Rhodovulum sulfidophilum]ANB35722.1 alpha/beta hydrolase [Rhodovulum sulfidophilum DSM 1374]ANB39544.1 alpha/beta hydrolase [Rhodovulum sulfidophilum]MCW2302837.1 pimeloyl-ACP methyl ester carboxylesterase [Rhodovulum sulfidophilum]